MIRRNITEYLQCSFARLLLMLLKAIYRQFVSPCRCCIIRTICISAMLQCLTLIYNPCFAPGSGASINLKSCSDLASSAWCGFEVIETASGPPPPPFLLQGCADNPSFIDEQGYSCAEWAVYDCNFAVLYGLTEVGQEALFENCALSCNTCSDSIDATDVPQAWTADRPCADNLSFRDEEGYSCVDWDGYDCESTGYTDAGEMSVLAACPMTCGICTVDPVVTIAAECVDLPGFLDEQNYSCDSWVGHDCLMAATFGYTKEGVAALIRQCRSSCKACTLGCQDTPGFKDAQGYDCSSWITDPISCTMAELSYG